jgi:uridine kinase
MRLAELLLKEPDTPSNLVQIAGRDYFDTKRQIRQTLDSLYEEQAHLKDFRQYLVSNASTDNSQVIATIAKEIVSQAKSSTGILLAAINGAAGLGKTTLSMDIASAIASQESKLFASTLPLDCFMLDRADRTARGLSGYDPKAHDFAAAKKAIESLIHGTSVSIRPYDHLTGKHAQEEVTVSPAPVLILDGIQSFHPSFLPRVHYKLFLHAPPPIAKEFRFLTDLRERGYTAHQAFQHSENEYNDFAQHILHYAKFADVIVSVDSYWQYSLSL